ncbi:MAG: molybdopterin-dependent oxidoreductase [Methylocella sp.]
MKTRILCIVMLLFSVVGVSTLAWAWAGPPFVVVGDVTTPTTFNLAKLRSLPVTNQNVTYFAAGSVVSQSFTGALLWDVLQSVGIVLNPNVKNDILRKIVVVTGSDGYQATFGAGEIAPNFGGDQILVAYAVNGQPLGSAGLARIVAPGDKQGGRFVSNIVKIDVETTQ